MGLKNPVWGHPLVASRAEADTASPPAAGVASSTGTSQAATDALRAARYETESAGVPLSLTHESALSVAETGEVSENNAPWQAQTAFDRLVDDAGNAAATEVDPEEAATRVVPVMPRPRERSDARASSNPAVASEPPSVAPGGAALAAVSGAGVAAPVAEPTAVEPTGRAASAPEAAPSTLAEAPRIIRQIPLSHNTALLQLDPPELGVMMVRVSQVDEQLTASFWADSSEVRTLLQSHLPALQEQLSQQGFQVHETGLSLATDERFDDHFNAFSQQGDEASSQREWEPSQEERGLPAVALDLEAHRVTPGAGRVDLTV